MDIERSIQQGRVPFRALKQPPKWPSECLVCGDACSETFEVRTYVNTRPPRPGWHDYFWTSNWGIVVRGHSKFAIPVHQASRPCLREFTRILPLWGWLFMLLPLAAAAWVFQRLGDIHDPEWISVLVVMLVFCIYLAFTVVKSFMPRYLMIWETEGKNYTACFDDKAYARKFADLNRDIVMGPPDIDWRRWTNEI